MTPKALSREEITAQLLNDFEGINQMSSFADKEIIRLRAYNVQILNVLLDIRDLLTKENNYESTK